MNIKKDFRNHLLKRRELIFELDSKDSPSNKGVKKFISEEFNKPLEVIFVYNIKSFFGRHIFEIYADIYDSADDLRKTIPKTRKQRKKEQELRKQERLKKSSDKDEKIIKKEENKEENKEEKI